MLILDTDIVVDVLRRYAPAVRWLEQLRDEQLAISGFSALEVLAGCRDKAEQDAIQQRLFSRFSVVWLSEGGCEAALKMYAAVHLGSRLGIIDALIGQTALQMRTSLCTFNTKHYSAIAGLQMVQPYER